MRLKQAAPKSSEADICLWVAASALKFPMMARHWQRADMLVTLGSLFWKGRKRKRICREQRNNARIISRGVLHAPKCLGTRQPDVTWGCQWGHTGRKEGGTQRGRPQSAPAWSQSLCQPTGALGQVLSLPRASISTSVKYQDAVAPSKDPWEFYGSLGTGLITACSFGGLPCYPPTLHLSPSSTPTPHLLSWSGWQFRGQGCMRYLWLWPPDVKSQLTEKDWCWERLRAGGEGDSRGRDGWMASLTQWTRV